MRSMADEPVIVLPTDLVHDVLAPCDGESRLDHRRKRRDATRDTDAHLAVVGVGCSYIVYKRRTKAVKGNNGSTPANKFNHP